MSDTINTLAEALSNLITDGGEAAAPIIKILVDAGVRPHVAGISSIEPAKRVMLSAPVPGHVYTWAMVLSNKNGIDGVVKDNNQYIKAKYLGSVTEEGIVRHAWAIGEHVKTTTNSDFETVEFPYDFDMFRGAGIKIIYIEHSPLF